jgi:hypothetical protein
VPTKLPAQASSPFATAAVQEIALGAGLTVEDLSNLNPSHHLQALAKRVFRTEVLPLATEDSSHSRSQIDRCGCPGSAGHFSVAPPTWLLKGA